MPDYSIETRHKGIVAGIDEAGCGPWAGPVVAAAVILDPLQIPETLLNSLNDSKKLSREKRSSLYEALLVFKETSFWVGLGQASSQEIDHLNIRRATLLAMERAYKALRKKPQTLLVDGIHQPLVDIPCYPIVRGDSLSLSIAAASIFAKVTRDALMSALGAEYPPYGWERNAGYGTKEHQNALNLYGVTPHHRQSYKPVQKVRHDQTFMMAHS